MREMWIRSYGATTHPPPPHATLRSLPRTPRYRDHTGRRHELALQAPVPEQAGLSIEDRGHSLLDQKSSSSGSIARRCLSSPPMRTAASRSGDGMASHNS